MEWNSNSKEEFDSRWIEITEKSGLSDNKWLQSIYEIRSSWIPSHVNHVFSAGMSSSQRAESQHFFFKSYVSEWNSLVEFMVQFKRGLIHQRHNELEEDHMNTDKKAKTVMYLDVEEHMAKIHDNKGLLQRRTKLLQHATDAIDKAMVSDMASQLFMESINFLENIKTLAGNESGQSAIVLKTKSGSIQYTFNEPNQVRAKGCGRRLKKDKEKKKVKVKDNQGRQCHGCGLFGQSHDKMNCPTLHGKHVVNKDGDSSSTSMHDRDSSSTSM
ncbi:hypothetical protein ACLB2K_044163 [Fragaria x ananassa]